jgi:hypothetical protein
LLQLRDFLARIEPEGSLLASLSKINETLALIDSDFIGNKERYESIVSELKKYLPDIETKRVFNTVLVQESAKASISDDLAKEILGCLDLMGKVSKTTSNHSIEDFKKQLSSKFETEMINLNIALDSNLGIGFGKLDSNSGLHPLLEGIGLLGGSLDSLFTIESTRAQVLLFDKIRDAKSNALRCLNLDAKEFAEFDPSWDTFSDSGSMMLTVIDAGEVYVRAKYVGGFNSLYLLGRFCMVDEKLNELGNKLANIDSSFHEDKIVAELVHVADDFHSSVLVRPAFREYEIPYLSTSLLPVSQQINANDILVGIDQKGGLSLFSRKHQKPIVPRLSNAHSFTIGSNPVYSFLAQMQQYGKRTSLDLNVDLAFAAFNHIPRIQIGRIILQDETWILDEKEIKQLETIRAKTSFYEFFKEFCRIREIPPYVLFKENEAELALNLENSECIEILLESVKGKKQAMLVDFFPFNDVNLSDSEPVRINEVIMFYNRKK